MPDRAASPAQVRALVDLTVLTPGFATVFRDGALTLNRALFHRAAAGTTLTVDLGAVLEPTSPRLARIAGDRRATVLEFRADGVLSRTNRAADAVRACAVLLPLLAAAALVGALAMAPRRRLALGVAGLAAAAGGALLLLALSRGHARAGDAIDLGAAVPRADARAAADAIWAVFSHGAHTVAVVAVAAGVTVALIGLWPRRLSS